MQGSGDAVHTQHRAAAVRQVRAGAEPGHRQRAAVQAQVLGQADGEGAGLLPQDARLVLRRRCDHAAQVPDPPQGRAGAAAVQLAPGAAL